MSAFFRFKRRLRVDLTPCHPFGWTAICAPGPRHTGKSSKWADTHRSPSRWRMAGICAIETFAATSRIKGTGHLGRRRGTSQWGGEERGRQVSNLADLEDTNSNVAKGWKPA